VCRFPFTGSTAVGKRLAAIAGARMKRVTMGLGGHALIDRKIPPREGRDRADRFLDGELVDPFGASRDHPPIGAARFLGKPIDDIGARECLALGFGDRLALFERH
jgi:hypothetical protein